MASNAPESPSDFAPNSPTDGRKLLDWGSKYPPEAQSCIRWEGWYLTVHLVACPLLLLGFWLVARGQFFGPASLARTIGSYGLAWVGGTLGGTLFSLKWLYHSVAREIWHKDRRCWRLFTPHISGGLSFAMLALISSGIIRVFDRGALHSGASIVGVSFIVGYFSDSAIAKLSELAGTLFGSKQSPSQLPRHTPAESTGTSDGPTGGGTGAADGEK